MDVTPLIPAGRQIIQAYGDGGFRISGQRWDGSVLVLPTRTLPWAVCTPAEVTPDSLSPLLDAESRPRLLLLGCGPAVSALPAALRQTLRAAGIILDVMDTAAACRTYSVLLTEDRQVAAALIAV